MGGAGKGKASDNLLNDAEVNHVVAHFLLCFLEGFCLVKSSDLLKSRKLFPFGFRTTEELDFVSSVFHSCFSRSGNRLSESS